MTRREAVMPVAVEMNFRGATLDQYDEILKKMELTPGGATPPEAISHWAAVTDDGIRVVDVWDTREAFDRYAAEKIGPYSAEAGIAEPPEMHFYDVHSHLGRGLDAS
jgi:hypothetical protein